MSHTFADDVLKAGSPELAREMVCAHIVKQSRRKFATSTRWPPSVFVGWALPRFYETTSSGDFGFLDSVIQGYVDAAEKIDPKFLPEFGGLFGRSMVIKEKELLNVYNTPQSRKRLCDMLCRLPTPALRELTRNLVGHGIQNLYTPPGAVLAGLLVDKDPTLIDTISPQALFKDIKWVSFASEDSHRAVDSLVRKVLAYQFDPSNGTEFSLRLASAPKQQLADFAYAMVELVNDLNWGPQDFSSLGKRPVRCLEKALTRARRTKPTALIKMPSPESIDIPLSAIRQAALSEIVRHSDSPTPRRPAM